MRWPTLKHDRRASHIVDCGRVWCPVRGRDIDVDRCVGCESFQDLARNGELRVICRPASPILDMQGNPFGC
jgi:hypothetical protein